MQRRAKPRLESKNAARRAPFSTTICPVFRQIPIVLLVTLLSVSCSGLSTLTVSALDEAQASWNAGKPPSYRLVVSMEGDRVERGEFDVEVQNGIVTSLKRNGEVVNPSEAQDYSMDGLF